MLSYVISGAVVLTLWSSDQNRAQTCLLYHVVFH